MLTREGSFDSDMKALWEAGPASAESSEPQDPTPEAPPLQTYIYKL